jgi:hypothetical protein
MGKNIEMDIQVWDGQHGLDRSDMTGTGGGLL